MHTIIGGNFIMGEFVDYYAGRIVINSRDQQGNQWLCKHVLKSSKPHTGAINLAIKLMVQCFCCYIQKTNVYP